jgi:hypothetical protein
MSMAAVLGNMAQWRPGAPRHRILPNEEDEILDEENQLRQRRGSHAGSSAGTPRSNSGVLNSSDAPVEPSAEVEEEEDGMDVVEMDDEDDLEEPPALRTDRLSDRMTLRELEEERELARRRTSVCLLLAVFLLFRLWVEALTQADFGLLMLSLVGTSWCARYIRHNREREEELDRRIQAYIDNNGNDPEGISRPDLRMLSFQAQLALAIMESQRQMMQGGFGHPDGNQSSVGVSDEARDQWERFHFKKVDVPEVGAKSKGGYGSVAQENKKLGDHEEEPTCTICLCEYEDGDTLVRLPCNHIYHDECLNAWTNDHSKCPLCNMDLESVATDASSAAPSSHQDD